MTLIFLLLVWNGCLVMGTTLVYVFVTRRRLRTYLLIEHLASIARTNLPIQTGLTCNAAELQRHLGE